MLKKYAPIIAVTNLLLSGLMAFINLNEWIKVFILAQTSEYPFGEEGSAPWYYLSSSYYSLYTFLFGLCSLTIFTVTMWTYDDRLDRTGIFLLMLNFFFLLLQVVSTSVH